MQQVIPSSWVKFAVNFDADGHIDQFGRPKNVPNCESQTENFYTITGHNWSYYCAMGMIELTQALAQKMPSSH